MKSVIVGAVESTQVALEVMAECGIPPQLLITLPPENAAMHSDFVDLRPLAQKLGVEVLLQKDVNAPECIEKLRLLAPEYIFVIGWSRLCDDVFLSIAREGAIGFHPTLLPQMRGRSALAWTLLLDLRETGSTLFWMDEGTDTGAIAAQSQFPLRGDEYLGDLISLHIKNLRGMMSLLLEKLKAGEKPALDQDNSLASYLALRRPSDGHIDWQQDAESICRLVRAVSKPYPGAFGYLGEKKMLIWRARPIDMRNWFAQPGQIFSVVDNCPVIRCGSGTSLLVDQYDIELPDGSNQIPPRVGNQRKLT